MVARIHRKSFYDVTSLDTLKVISDPLRIEIMEQIGMANDLGELLTVKALAARLSSPLHKLYYHVNLLESHGLLQVADTQIVSGIIEKHYAMTARQVRIAENLFNSGERTPEKTASAVALFDAAVQSTRSDFVTLMESTKAEREHLATFSGRGAHFTQERVRLSAEQARAFQARLLALAEEFTTHAPEPDSPDTATYNLMTVLIPSLRS